MLNELFPIVAGALLGLVVGTVRPSLRLWVGIPIAAVLGILATVVSGEFRIGWEFLLIDIPLVGASAAATFLAGRVIRRQTAKS
jgi:hypothetical protein